jgi:alkylation response protein AidB-like acyl-CoA dehydrogenase
VFAPNGTGVATTVDGVDGFSVSGRWSWGSGTQHCRWVLGGARCDDGTFRLCWFPQSEVTFHDTWYTTGMRGSGSLDYSVAEVFVSAERTIQPAVTRPVVRTPLSQFPNFTLLASGVSAVGLGIARRALDELVDIAQGKKPQYSSKTLAQSSYTQIELARAEAKLRAARAFLLDELESAWAAASEGNEVTVEARTGIRLAATHAASVGAEVTDVAFTLAGGTAVYDTSPLGRCLRDAHIVTQHIQTAPKLNETIGRLLLGLDVDTSMF